MKTLYTIFVGLVLFLYTGGSAAESALCFYNVTQNASFDAVFFFALSCFFAALALNGFYIIGKNQSRL